MRTIVYIDGFNLYYRLLRDNPEFKWLNIAVLGSKVLGAGNKILKTRFFTARVSGRFDQQAPARQNAYLSALTSEPTIDVHYGNFLVSKTWAGMVPPDLDPAKPKAKPPFMPWPNVVRIWKTEEKGSDVNLAVNLLNDAFQNSFDVAAVVTNDTDLAEALRIARSMGKVVGLLTPVAKPAPSLSKVADFCHHIRDAHLSTSQFPDVVQLANGKVAQRPASWVKKP